MKSAKNDGKLVNRHICVYPEPGDSQRVQGRVVIEPMVEEKGCAVAQFLENRACRFGVVASWIGKCYRLMPEDAVKSRMGVLNLLGYAISVALV